MLGTVLLVLLILLLLGALPTWGHSRNWGYFPRGGLGWWCWLWSRCCCWAAFKLGFDGKP